MDSPAHLVEQARRKAKEKHDAHIAAATAAAYATLQADLQIIEGFAKLVSDNPESVPEQLNGDPESLSAVAPVVEAARQYVNDKRRRPEGPSGLVRTAITALAEEQGDFTLIEIDDWLNRNGLAQLGRPVISNVLNKLKERGEIHIHKPGAGNRPGVWACGPGPVNDESEEIKETATAEAI